MLKRLNKTLIVENFLTDIFRLKIASSSMRKVWSTSLVNLLVVFIFCWQCLDIVSLVCLRHKR